MKLEVRSPDPIGEAAYQRIAEIVIAESGASGLIDEMKVYIDTEEPVTIVYVKYRGAERRRTLKELATIEAEEGGVRVAMEDELFAVEALRELWRVFGRSAVEQISRLEFFVYGAKPEDVEKVEVQVAPVAIEEIVGEVVHQILPEGFRVRKFIHGQGMLTVVASEDPIQSKWLEMAKRLAKGETP